jgi:hypothetical protein
MVPSLLSELAVELQIPRTEHFCYAERAVQDLWDGLRKRIATIVTPAISQLFLEYLNDIDKLDLYLEDPEQAILETERNDFQNRVTKAHCAFLQNRVPSLLLKVQETADLCKKVRYFSPLSAGYDRITPFYAKSYSHCPQAFPQVSFA